MENPYGKELKGRMVGMDLEAELSGFLQGIEREWVTRSKKKIVDANVLGLHKLDYKYGLQLCIACVDEAQLTKTSIFNLRGLKSNG